MLTLDGATVEAALSLKARHGVSYWDALILASSLDAGCSVVYREDLAHGQRYSGIPVVNPFLA